MPTIDYEKLGVFYLGSEYDVAERKRTGPLLLYDSKDLVTHAVCVGMTGSGKTGLCIGLIEEAAIDSIPAIVIDPKGDLSNLLLTFPDLRAEDFRPWINEEDARKKSLTPDEHAAKQAELWKKGLAEWDQSPERIARLRNAADFSVYTPGSTAGRQVSVLRSFDAPARDIIDDVEVFRERISSTATSLLGLLGIDADPLQSREHILLSTILAGAWEKGQSLDLPALIRQIQHPPVTRVGVMELETFYPAQDRFTLALSLNNLVASPGFSRWTEGEPLDVGAMLFTPQGKPRVSIFSIAHLNDAERMFFVSMLLNQTLGWVRQQSGTSSLRAIVYMDEIAGYFPPTANPPSKQPLLTLMKQARAFGVGIVLSTQNPVDLDYKGLSNAGTWFIGRLQTERDKARVLDGLEGAMATASVRFDRSRVDDLLSQLSSRVFLMNNVHEDAPVIFETRWALSYLRGPMTRNQLRSLTGTPRVDQKPEEGPRDAAGPIPADPATPAPTPLPVCPPTASPPTADKGERPVLPPEIHQYFVPVRAAPPGARLVYLPMLLGCARIYYADERTDTHAELNVSYLAPINAGPVPIDWDRAAPVNLSEADVDHAAAEGVAFSPLPAVAATPRSYDAWKKSLVDSLFRSHRLELMRSPSLKLVSELRETEGAFRARLRLAAREQRDAQVEKLRQKYAPQLAAIQEKLRRGEQAVEVQREQAKSAKLQSAFSIGSAILAAFTGRKIASAGNVGRAATAARGVSRSSKEASDIDRAEANLKAAQQKLADLDARFQAEALALSDRFDAAAEELDSVSIKPKKSNIGVRAVMLAWAPHSTAADGSLAPAW